jgi:hypothetical protein
VQVAYSLPRHSIDKQRVLASHQPDDREAHNTGMACLRAVCVCDS